ncbi:MAG: PAS domain S-box protein [Telluria sp.]
MQPWTFPTDRRLGAYLALAFSLLSIVLTLILVEVIGSDASDRMRSQIGGSLQDLAVQTANQLDRGMFERYREVRLMAGRSDVTVGDAPTRRRALEAFQATYPYYAWIGVAGMDGKVQSATRGMLEGADVSQRPWFKNALRGNNLGDVHEAVLLAKLLPAQGKDAEPPRFVDVAFPILGDAGEPTGVLGAHLSWTWAQDVERAIFEPSVSGHAVNSVIVGAKGSVILGPPDLRGKTLELASIAAARSGAGYDVEDWPDGGSYLVGWARGQGYRDYPGMGWTVLVRQPVDLAFEPVAHIQRNVFWSGMAVAALFSLLGLVAAKRITQPITRLADAAERIKNGELAALPDTRGAYSEVATLTNSLSALLEDLLRQKNALADLNATLETRVQDRTAELAIALQAVRSNEERIRTIIDTAQDGFIVTDTKGCILQWNVAAERMFGWAQYEVVGRSLQELIVPERYRQRFDDAMAQIRSGEYEPGRFERTVHNRDGQEFTVEASVGLVNEGGRQYFSAFLHDISERRKAQRMREEFITTVSHELRTPLTSIRASLSVLASGMAGELPPDVHQLIIIAHDSCERLVRLVNDMLDIEKVGSGHASWTIESQPLAPVLRAAVDGVAGFASQHKVDVSLTCHGEPHALFDRDALLQVLTNLLSNAIKFSHPGGAVELQAGQDEARALIFVADHGEGIPAAFRDRVFEKFAQADTSTRRRVGGTGLGLAICKSIVEGHGGRIWFDTEIGAGTTFYVELPA